MNGKASLSPDLAARNSVKANSRLTGVKARGAGRSQNPRLIEAKLRGCLS